MSAGFMNPQTLNIAATGTGSYYFTIDDSPWISFQAMKPLGGAVDAKYTVLFSNVPADRILGYGQYLSGTVTQHMMPSGSQYRQYWCQGTDKNGTPLTGTFFTGSAGDPPYSAMVDLTDPHNARFCRLDVTSVNGGIVTVFPMTKTG